VGTGRWVAAATGVGLLFTLGGCVAVDGRFDLGTDDRISIDLLLQLDEASAKRGYGGDVCEILEGAWPWAADTDLEPTSRDGAVGCRLTSTLEVSALDPRLDRSYRMGVTGLSVAHLDGEYRFRWDPGYGNGDAAAATDYFQIQVTFPGEVRSHSGSSTVDGTTVTWRSVSDLMTDGGLAAVGDDRPGVVTLLRNPFSWAVILLLVLAGGIGFERRRWKQADETASAGPDTPTPRGQPPEPRLVMAGPAPSETVAPQAWAPRPADVPGVTSGLPAPPPQHAVGPQPRSPWAPPE